MGAPGIRGLPTVWVNVTPHCWVWPVATTMFSRQQWWGKDLWFYAHVKRRTRIFALPAFHRYHICPGHVYLYLQSCYVKVSSTMTHIAPIYESINNWLPPVEYVALYVVSWRGLFLAYEEFVSVLQGRWSNWGLLGARPTSLSVKFSYKISAGHNYAWQSCCIYQF